ncbi:hypothetical protein C1896_12255 [Pseudomonadaceae bacterium SI-3]|nr:hypothetical protein C1896_12255 [Pseudomonadaceae bacterium SI-3]
MKLRAFRSMAGWVDGHRIAVVLAALLVGLAITFASYQSVRSKEAEAARLRFDRIVSDTARDIGEAMKQYERLLQAASSHLYSRGGIERGDWKKFAEHLQLQDRYPGLLGLGYTPAIPGNYLEQHIQAIRAEGFPSYTVIPSGVRDLHTPVAYLEPFSGRNLKAFGFDMYSEEVRRAAMETARDGGAAALSGKVWLVQEGENPQPGTIMFQPIYRDDSAPLTVEVRRAALQGFVYSAFRMPDLMHAALGNRVGNMALQLFDGDSAAQGALLYERRIDVLSDIPSYKPAFDEDILIVVGQRTWKLRLVTLPAFDVAMPASRSPTILGAGIVLSILLSALLSSALTMRARAQALADHMTIALKDSEAATRSIVESAAEGIVVTDCNPEMAIQTCNEAAERMFGWLGLSRLNQPFMHLLSFDEMQKKLLADLRSGQRASARFDIYRPDSGGEVVELSLSATVSVRSGIRSVIIIVADLTDLHAAQRQALQASLQSQSIILHSPFAIMSTDLAGIVTAVNPAGVQLVGYAESDLVRTSILQLHDPIELSERCAKLSEELGQLKSPADLILNEPLRDEGKEAEWTYVHQSGKRIPICVKVSVIRNADSQATGLVYMAYDITERKRTEDQIRHLALHDPLTGLPNRNLMHDRMNMAINRAMRNNQRVGVMLLDLDHFKQINDQHGHQIGDEVLKAAAQRISGAVRQIDTVIRTGGDEFVVVLGELSRDEDVQRIAESIIEAMRAELVLPGLHLNLSTSIGIAIYPYHGLDLDSLLHVADQSMYEAKRNGRNTFKLPAIAQP